VFLFVCKKFCVDLLSISDTLTRMKHFLGAMILFFSTPSSFLFASDIITLNFPYTTIAKGQTISMTWTEQDSDATAYTVHLLGGSLGQNKRTIGLLDTDTVDSFSWAVPSDLEIGSGYQIQFVGAGTAGDTTNLFSITGPSTQTQTTQSTTTPPTTTMLSNTDLQKNTPAQTTVVQKTIAPSTATITSSMSSIVSTCVAITKDLSFRSKDTATSKSVYQLQRFLETNGYLRIKPTGYYGLFTKEATKAFQNEYFINPTGKTGPITRAKIRALTCK